MNKPELTEAEEDLVGIVLDKFMSMMQRKHEKAYDRSFTQEDLPDMLSEVLVQQAERSVADADLTDQQVRQIEAILTTDGVGDPLYDVVGAGAAHMAKAFSQAVQVERLHKALGQSEDDEDDLDIA